MYKVYTNKQTTKQFNQTQTKPLNYLQIHEKNEKNKKNITTHSFHNTKHYGANQ